MHAMRLLPAFVTACSVFLGCGHGDELQLKAQEVRKTIESIEGRRTSPPPKSAPQQEASRMIGAIADFCDSLGRSCNEKKAACLNCLQNSKGSAISDCFVGCGEAKQVCDDHSACLEVSGRASP
jgi:hypothetical protein